MMTTEHPESFYVDLPCPRCGMYNVHGANLILEDYGINHTRYYCWSWIKPESGPSQGVPCAWEGWTVPGADDATE